MLIIFFSRICFQTQRKKKKNPYKNHLTTPIEQKKKKLILYNYFILEMIRAIKVIKDLFDNYFLEQFSIF